MTSPLRTLLLIADVLTALHLLAGGSGAVVQAEVQQAGAAAGEAGSREGA